MGGFSIWHLAILGIVFVPMIVVPLIVVLVLPKPQGENRFGPPSHPAASGRALVRGFRNYFVFAGRACRSEYWWFLFWAGVAYLPFLMFGFRLPFLAFLPVIFYIPLLSASIRRLQDANRSGLWVLLAFGGPAVIALLLLLAEPSRGDD